MTAQTPDTLILRGGHKTLVALPLSDWLEAHPPQEPFREMHTACWRRYVATWIIESDKLYLIAVRARWEDGRPVNIADLFPTDTWPVWADWFTGELRLQEGRMLEYRHVGFGSVYERERFIQVEHGQVLGERVVETKQDVEDPVAEMTPKTAILMPGRGHRRRPGLLERLGLKRGARPPA
jgi:hypothetical protein